MTAYNNIGNKQRSKCSHLWIVDNLLFIIKERELTITINEWGDGGRGEKKIEMDGLYLFLYIYKIQLANNLKLK